MSEREPKPLVTVIVCVYNAGDYLRPSIESVLAQSHARLQVLVVDDGSTDGCVDFLDGLDDERVEVIRQTNRGKPAALNVGLTRVAGSFYMVHDADDLSHPERVARQLSCLLENPDVAAVFCGNDLLLDDVPVAPTSRAKDRAACSADISSFRMPAHDPTAMYRWSLVQHLRYDEDLRLGEGLDYILRVGEQHPILVLGECLYSYRIHSSSITRQNPALREQLVQRVIDSARRRRGLTASPVTAPPARRRRRDLDNNLAAHFIDSVHDLRGAGRRAAAVRVGWRCVRLQPSDPHYYKALLYATAPSSVVERIRRVAQARRSP
jgi:glycosyltransferase involved in cell wall biosynthesis